MLDKYLKNKFLYVNKYNLLKKIYFFIYHTFKKKGSHKKSFSNGGVDLLVNYFFKNKNSGFYIDVGCGHPTKGNNTYLLYNRGWQGINIDLDNFNIELFKTFRPKDYNINIAVSDKEDVKDLFFYHHKSEINTIEKRVFDLRNKKVEKIKKINTQTLNSILENFSFKNNKIDFLSIDVEGHELNVLKGFDLHKYQPDVLVVEFLDLSLKKLEFYEQNIETVLNSDIYNYLLKNNYYFVNWLHSDLVFVNKKIRN